MRASPLMRWVVVDPLARVRSGHRYPWRRLVAVIRAPARVWFRQPDIMNFHAATQVGSGGRCGIVAIDRIVWRAMVRTRGPNFPGSDASDSRSAAPVSRTLSGRSGSLRFRRDATLMERWT
jgi:hypothetical protein